MKLGFSSHHGSKRAARAFTLVELMVVIAIISVLAALALPAYNNYTLKSKFTEVVLATGPTKTAISTCAVSGDCVSAGAISLGMGGAAEIPVSLVTYDNGLGGPGVPIMSPAAQYAYAQAFLYGYKDYYTPIIMDMYGISFETWADQQSRAAVDGGAYANVGMQLISADYASRFNPSPAPGTMCLTGPQGIEAVGCQSSAFDPATLTPFSVPSANPYLPAQPGTGSGAGSVVALPCVGPSAGCSPATKYVASVSYDSTGVITGTAQTSSGLNAETFVLAPALSGGRVDWAASGTCKTRDGGALC